MTRFLKECVDKWGDHRALRQDEKHAENEDNEDGGQHPPALIANKKRKQFAYGRKPPFGHLDELHAILLAPNNRRDNNNRANRAGNGPNHTAPAKRLGVGKQF
jgi:hypothetical protein